MFLGNNFFTVFVEAPLVVDALGNCPVCSPLNPALLSPAERLNRSKCLLVSECHFCCGCMRRPGVLASCVHDFSSYFFVVTDHESG